MAIMRNLSRIIFIIVFLAFVTTIIFMLHVPDQNGDSTQYYQTSQSRFLDSHNNKPQRELFALHQSPQLPLPLNPLLRKKEKLLKNVLFHPSTKLYNNTVYNLNVTLSDGMSLDRNIEDTRPPRCQEIFANPNLVIKGVTASVVIPFYNEAASMLLRTVHSVLNRSPNELLNEVILVDDCSTRPQLQEPLREYVQLLPKVTQNGMSYTEEPRYLGYSYRTNLHEIFSYEPQLTKFLYHNIPTKFN